MKTGIFGGSFNPIHNGHAIIARYAMEHCGLDRVWLMVSPQNPLKDIHDGIADVHRIRMTEMVSRRIVGVSTSGFEFGLPRPSFTVDTLAALQERFPHDEFHLIIGADNWAVWNKWKGHDELVSKYKVLIYPRLGYDVEISDDVLSRVTLMGAPVVEISSTDIRQRVKDGLDITFLVPDDVAHYIENQKLYR
ncbi:MAG: nicotinate-nucleotide adenylyltransferase [Muribaculaceae bacterium]|nr:nicotinate-nucleotide adenylyltransferase [Muribaculaceae bacterium]